MFERIAREPLVHFLALGLLVFGLQLALDPSEEGAIAVDRAVEAEVERALAEELARVPTEAELEAAVDAWVRTEVLVLEARRLGLDEGDAVVRERLADKMREVLRAVEVPPAPTEADLSALRASLGPAAPSEEGLRERWRQDWLDAAEARAVQRLLAEHPVRR